MARTTTLLTLVAVGLASTTMGGQRVVRRQVGRSRPGYREHRQYLARQAMLERKGQEPEGGEDMETEEADNYDSITNYPMQFGLEMPDEKESRSYTPHSGCEIRHETVTVVKQVPSFTKHCQKVEDTKCKTVYKNAFTTQIETQCMATFDTSCDNTLETAYKQQCRTIVDVECRIVNLESKDGQHESKKICEDVPTEKCIPVPVKVEGQKCVNVPTQMCENVPVTVAQEVPQQQCYKKPRKVCQTLVSTKPKVVTAQIPREVCGHESPAHEQAKQKSGFPQSSAGSSPYQPLPPSFRPSLAPKGVAKHKETFQADTRPNDTEDYEYDDTNNENENDSFGSFPRPQGVNKPEGFNDNLLQFLQQNN